MQETSKHWMQRVHGLLFMLELLRRRRDDHLVDFHLGRLFDGVSKRAIESARIGIL